MPTNNVARLPVQPWEQRPCFVWEGALADAIAHLASHRVKIETGTVERFGALGQGLAIAEQRLLILVRTHMKKDIFGPRRGEVWPPD
jgi:hypothetical protein